MLASGARQLKFAIFVFFLSVYLLTMSGHFYTRDEETMYYVAEGLVQRHTFSIPDDRPVVDKVRGVDGKAYSKFGIGQSLVAVPLFAVGEMVARPFPSLIARQYLTRFFVAMLNPLVTALTGVVLFSFLRRLDYSSRTSLLAALTYGLATGAWPHSKTFFAEPLTALLLLAAFYFLHDYQDRRSWAYVALSGLCMAGAAATKMAALIALPAVLLYLGLAFKEERSRLKPLTVWMLAFSSLMLLVMWYNYALFGSPFSTGYGDSPWTLFHNPLARGLYGLLLSPGKGVFVYSPPTALFVLSIVPFFREHRREVLVFGLMILLHLLFYAKLEYWHGDASWGPRYMVFVLPYLIIPLAAFWERGGRMRKGVVVALIVIGVLVQLLGLLVNFATYINVKGNLAARHFDLAASPLAGHARLLWARTGEWYRYLFSGQARPVVPPIPQTHYGRWDWFFSPLNHHLVDLWFWYFYFSQLFAGPPAYVLVLSIAGLSLTGSALAGSVLWRGLSLPAGRPACGAKP